MKNLSINHNQLFSLLIIFIISSATLSDVSRQSGQAMWIVLLICGSLGCLFYWMYYSIAKKHNFVDFSVILKRTFGKKIGTTLMLAYIIYALYCGTRILNKTTHLVKFALLRDTGIWIIIILLTVAVVYGVMKGLNAIARSSEIILIFLLTVVLFVILLILSSGSFHMEYLQPIFGDDWNVIREDIKSVAMFPYAETVVFIILFSFMNKDSQPKILKKGLLAIMISTVIIIGINMASIGVTGAFLHKELIYPLYNSTKVIGTDIIFQRFDPIPIAFEIIACAYKIMIYFFTGSYLLSKILKRFSYQQLMIPIGILCLIVGKNLSQTATEDIYYSLIVEPKYIHPFFCVYVPLTIWVISLIKFKKQNVNQNSEY